MILPNGKEIIYQYNAREILVNANKCALVTCSNTTLNLDLCYNYTIGDKVHATIDPDDINYSTYYMVNSIKRISSKKYKLQEFTCNDSSIFMLPLLEIPKQSVLDECLINAYITSTYESEEDVVYLTYRFLPHDFYTDFDEKIQKHRNFVMKFNNNDKRFNTFVFSIPKKFHEDYLYFTESKFNKFSKLAKSFIEKFHGLKKDDEVYLIINDDIEYRRKLGDKLGYTIPMEIPLRTKIDIEKETLNY